VVLRTLTWALVQPAALSLLVAIGGLAQQPARASAGPAFDVASVKPSPESRGPVAPMQVDSGRVVYNNMSPKILIQIAYKAADWEIAGGPGWLESDRYDVAATLPSGSSGDQIPAMLQALLAERFHLVVRREARELPVLGLTVAKGGPKLKPGDTGEQWTGGAVKGGIFNGRLELHNIDMAGLAEALAGRTGHPVVDMTHLTGAFDVSLKWTPDNAPPGDAKADGPSLYTALGEQLGLRLESTKAPVGVIVVDHMEKPGGN